MEDILISGYPWVKSLHIMAVMSWMAGLFYLPRLYVYHAEQSKTGDQLDVTFQVMERRLLKAIMNPAMIVSWACGVWMVLTPGIIDWTAIWPYSKGVSIIAMTWFHMWCGARRIDFVAANNTRTGRDFRIMNEVPTLLMIIIVLSVIVKF